MSRSIIVDKNLWEKYDEWYWSQECCNHPCINYSDEEGHDGARRFFEWLLNNNSEETSKSIACAGGKIDA